MTALLLQINIGSGGVPKRATQEVFVGKDRIVGDDWNWSMYKTDGEGKSGGHGGPNRALCLIANETIHTLQSLGYEVYPGALGENLTTNGLDYSTVRIGDLYRTGPVIFCITDVRTPCKTINQAYPSLLDPDGLVKRLWDIEMQNRNFQSTKWGQSGFYARVVTEGVIRIGDRITKLDELP